MDNAPKPMKQSDFERKVKLYRPSLISITKVLNGNKFEIREVFVHFSANSSPYSKCLLKMGTNAFAEMLKELANGASS